MAIRSNVGNLYPMKKGIAAIIHHCTEYLVKVDGNDKKKFAMMTLATNFVPKV